MNTNFLNKLHTALSRGKCSVYLHAFLDLNVGDDLFVHKVIASYPQVRFVMIAKKPYKKILAKYPNVTVFEQDGFPLNLCRKLGIYETVSWHIAHDCDYGLYVGGSIFIEYSDWKDQHSWYRELYHNDRLFIMGCNWGPYRTEQFKDNMRSVFSGMRDICFRDRYSYNAFSDLPNVSYAPDIMFGMDWTPYLTREEKKQVLISVVDCRSRSVKLAEYTADYHRFIAGLTERFAELGYQVVLSAFWERNGDLAAAEEIRESLSPRAKESTSVVSYRGTNLDQILELIAESEYVVATRFHAMILGLSAKKKVLPLIYNLKTRTALEDLTFNGACYDITQLPEDCAGVIEKITPGITDSQREELARLSEAHFDRFSQLIGSMEG